MLDAVRALALPIASNAVPVVVALRLRVHIASCGCRFQRGQAAHALSLDPKEVLIIVAHFIALDVATAHLRHQQSLH